MPGNQNKSIQRAQTSAKQLIWKDFESWIQMVIQNITKIIN